MQTALEKLQFDVEQGTRDVSELAEVRFIYIFFSLYLMTEYLYILMLFVNDYYFRSVLF